MLFFGFVVHLMNVLMWHLAAALMVCTISWLLGLCGMAGSRSPFGLGIIVSSMQALLPSGIGKLKTRLMVRLGSWCSWHCSAFILVFRKSELVSVFEYFLQWIG